MTDVGTYVVKGDDPVLIADGVTALVDDRLTRRLVATRAIGRHTQIVDDDPSTEPRELECLHPTEPPTRAGHDRDLAFQFTHDSSLQLPSERSRGAR